VIERASGSLQHTAFFEALGGITEGHADWAATSAGLMVLRLIDGWLTEGSQAPQVSVWGVRAVRGAIESMPQGEIARSILTSVLDSVESSQMPDIRPLAPRLLAYGRYLDHGARWALAIDVYESTLAYLPPELDADIAIDACMRLAHCFRVVGRFDDAASAYGRAKQIATMSGDGMKALHARVGEGTLAVARGNLPLGESILDEAIAATETAGFDDVRAIALHGRAFVANARAQYDVAARFAYDALRLTHSLTARDRILIALALALTQVGTLGAARDAFLVVAATGQEQLARWTAMVNLMEIGAMQTNEPLFERNRRELMDEALPPYLRAQYHYYSAVGHRAFGKLAAAESCLTQANELAEQHGLNQLVFEIEELRSKVRHGVAAERRTARDLPALRDITDAVSEMRDLVGV
jgi:tetratricopeptide (TPR) repeat protein